MDRENFLNNQKLIEELENSAVRAADKFEEFQKITVLKTILEQGFDEVVTRTLLDISKAGFLAGYISGARYVLTDGDETTPLEEIQQMRTKETFGIVLVNNKDLGLILNHGLDRDE